MKNNRDILVLAFIVFLFAAGISSASGKELFKAYPSDRILESTWQWIYQPLDMMKGPLEPNQETVDLIVTKSDTPDPVNINTNLTYIITVTNNGPAVASSVRITDTLSTGVALKSVEATSSGSCGQTSPIVCLYDTLASGSSVQITIVVTPTVTGLITNTATVKAVEIDSNETNNFAEQVTDVRPAANLAVSKADAPDPVKAGEDVTYTLVVTNNGPSAAQNVVLTDTLPSGVTYKSVTAPGWACNPPVSGKVRCTRATLDVGSSTVTLVVTVSPAVRGSLDNQVEVRSATSDPDVTNNQANAATSVTAEADLELVKTAATLTPYVGSNAVFTLTLTNKGPSQATGVQVTDLLPSGYNTGPLTYAASQGSYNKTTGVWDVGAVNPNQTATLRITVEVKESGVYNNYTQVTAVTEPDPDSTKNNNSTNEDDDDTLVVTPIPVANLAVSKADAPDPVKAGEDVTYTLVVTNNGPSAAQNVVLTDTLPSGVTYKSVTAPGWTCNPPVSGKVRCTRATLDVGSSTVTLVVTVSPAVRGSLDNQVEVRSATADLDVTNNQANAATSVTAEADLELVKTAATLTPYVGSNAVFTLTLTNKGPSQATGVQVTDQLPSGYNTGPLTYAASQGSYNKTTGVWDVGAVNPNQTATLRITVEVKESGVYNNYTQVTAVTEPDPDSTKNNNSTNEDDDDTLVVTPIPVANLAVSKADTPDPVKAGNDVTYSLVVSNGGPSAAQNVVLTDTLPSGVTYKSVTAPGWSCTQPTGKVRCTLSSLGVDSSTVTLVVTVSPSASGSLNNQVEVRSATVDLNGDNNQASAVTGVTAEADLAVSKADAPDPVKAGEDVTYTLVVTNNGPSAAQNVVLTDTLPSGVTYKSVTAPGWTCNPPVSGKVRCTRATLDVGSSTVTLVVTVSPAVRGSLDNQVEVRSATADLDVTNNQANAATSVTAEADLELVKTAATLTPYVGSNAVFTLTLTNKGPSQATGVQVTDQLPSGYNTGPLTYAASQGSYNKTTGVWDVGAVNPNQTATLRITVEVKESGVYNNYTQVTAVTEPDPDSTKNNNSTNEDDDDTLVVTPIPVADLVIVQTDNPDPVTAGDDVTYTLVVSNAGPSPAQSLVVTDTLPAGVTFKSASGSNWICTTPQTGIVRCTRSSLNVLTNTTITVVATVNPSTLEPLTNLVRVSSSAVDFYPATNTNSETTAVQARANLSVVKSDTPDPVNAGTNLTYNLAVSNAGPSDAVNIILTDTLPAGVVYQSVSGTGWSCTPISGRVTCTRPSLVAGADAPITLVVKVNSNTIGSISNTAQISSGTTDPNLGDNSTSAVTAVKSAVDLRINQLDSVDPVIAGDVLAYSIVITNTGPSDAWTLVMTDTLPGGTSLVTGFGSGWNCFPVAVGARCERSSLPVNVSTSINVVVQVDQGLTGSLTNLVVVSARGSTELQPADNSKTEITSIITRANLGIAKIESVDPVIAGTNLTYTLTVTNAGLSRAVNVVVTDTLHANVTYQSHTSPPGWTCTLVGSRLRCTSSAMSAGASSTIAILTRVNSGASGSLSNQAEVRSNTTDPTPGNNSVTISTAVIQRADLDVVKLDNPDPVPEGQVLTYTLTVTNLGPSNASGVSLTENIPAEVQYLSTAVIQGSATCSGSGPVTCSLGTLVSGGVVKVQVRTQAKPVNNTPKTATNTASVSSTTTDPVPGNNSRTQTTSILPAADLKLGMLSSSTAVQAGDLLTYTLTVTNTGPSIATNLIVTDTLPAEMTYVSSSIPPFYPSGSQGANPSPNRVVWKLGNLNPAGVLRFTLVVRVVSKTQPLVNRAEASADQWDVVYADSLDEAVIQAVDSVPPTVAWMDPWEFGKSYTVSSNMIRLYATASDNVGVWKVRFYRWDAVENVFKDIGYDYDPAPCEGNPGLQCYEFTFDSRDLNPGYNEIRVRSFDTSENFYPPLDGPFVWLYIRRYVYEVFMPVLMK